MSDRYLIWSHQHRAWWGPDRCGYVENANDAGRYTAQEAGDITVAHIPPGEEVAVHEAAVGRITGKQYGPIGVTRT